jgi:hypothetical protein
MDRCWSDLILSTRILATESVSFLSPKSSARMSPLATVLSFQYSLIDLGADVYLPTILSGFLPVCGRLAHLSWSPVLRTA